MVCILRVISFAAVFLSSYSIASEQDINLRLASTGVDPASGFAVSVGTGSFCAIDAHGLQCWGNPRNRVVANAPTLVKPRKVRVSTGSNACALDDSGLICWGSNAAELISEKPPLSNPIDFDVSTEHACAIDDNGVVCWGVFYNNGNATLVDYKIPPMDNPTSISVGRTSICAIDDDVKLLCWGLGLQGLDPIQYEGIRAVDVTGSHLWLVDERGSKFISSDGRRGAYPDYQASELPNPIAISAGQNGLTCFINSAAIVSCETIQPGEVFVPPSDYFSNPRAISAGSSVACVIDDDGLKCWSIWFGIMAIPEFDFSGPANDSDGDMVLDTSDNCPLNSNPDQSDLDADGLGDVCDPDDDNDGVEDTLDNCPVNSNNTQTDFDDDGIGDACDSDNDNDGILDDVDNCPLISNSGQDDTDGDALGNACDSDDDNDLVNDDEDNCPLVANPNQENADNFGSGDACLDETVDPDGDLFETPVDNCPNTSNPSQYDFDGDGLGDVCDSDDDNDYVFDEYDYCPSTPEGAQVDLDGCTLEQRCPCEGPAQSADPWKSHGQYVSCVTQAANTFNKEGLISGEEKGRITEEAAQSACGF